MQLFDLYRRLLLIICTVYATVRLIQGLQTIWRRLSGPQRHMRLARGYVGALLWSVHLRRFWPELLQILGLLVLLGIILAAHRWVMR